MQMFSGHHDPTTSRPSHVPSGRSCGTASDRVAAACDRPHSEAYSPPRSLTGTLSIGRLKKGIPVLLSDGQVTFTTSADMGLQASRRLRRRPITLSPLLEAALPG